MSGKCVWSQEDEYGTWFEGSCGFSFCFNDEGVKENEFVYCPKCGKIIEEKLWEIPSEEDEV